MSRLLGLITICSGLWHQVNPLHPASFTVKSILSAKRDKQQIGPLFAENPSSKCLNPGTGSELVIGRRPLLTGAAVVSFSLVSAGYLKESLNRSAASTQDDRSWAGTSLTLMSIDDADEYSIRDQKGIFPFAHWPDPILRRPASRLDVTLSTEQLATLRSKVQRIASSLQRTAHYEGAVGLAAQQCGVDLSLVYVKTTKRDGIFLLNPRIVDRSPEYEMLVWTEECLVLPPSFRATLLRDAVVTIEYEDPLDETSPESFPTKQITLSGELARCAQHEMQHDRGILIVDHVLLEELPDYMREIEAELHQTRMRQAFTRDIAESTPAAVPASNNKLLVRRSSDPPEFFVSPANAVDTSEPTVAPASTNKDCDETCIAERKRIIEQRRAMMKQARTTTRRQDMFDLSRQRAALYGTTYRGARCPPGNSTIPCL